MSDKLIILINCVFVTMTTIYEDGADAFMECRCGHRFWVDACTEENLRIATNGDRRELVAFCSKCGAWERRSWMG